MEALTASAARYDFSIDAYCFMPDHLHLLVTGGERSSLVRFLQRFKQATGHQHCGLWQRSFYDHILRYEEAIDGVANYIWSNPVTAGFVEDALDYPFSGPLDTMLAATGRAVPQETIVLGQS